MAFLNSFDEDGDLPAFQALNRLRRAGVETLAVAVGGAETPPELTEAADLVLGGPAQVVEFLEALLRRPA